MQHPGAWRTLLALAVAVVVAGCGTTVTPSPSVPASPTVAPTPSASPAPTPIADGSAWVPAGTLLAGRASTHAVAIADGRVLVVGSDNFCTPGWAWDESSGAEVFDPAAGTWSGTGSLNAPRDGFVAVALTDGRVLVAGGVTAAEPAEGAFGSYSSTKLYDAQTGTWSATGLLNVARYAPAGALLHDGTVLVAGGTYIDSSTQRDLASAEIYDPEFGTWSRTGDFAAARTGAQAVTLADGRVLVVGGSGPDSGEPLVATAEIYDPATATWTSAGSLGLGREDFSLVALPDGGALVVGGFVGGDAPATTASTERLDPRSLTWSSAGAMGVAATNPTAVLLGDGRVLVAGGMSGPDFSEGSVAIADAELYDPATGTWTATAPLPEPRERAAAATLADGSILLAGGDRGYVGAPSAPWCPEPIAAAIRYVPANLASFPKPTPGPAATDLAISDVPRASALPAEAKKAAAAINAFGLDLYQRILADASLDLAGRNVVVSPTSIALALAMARAGARGETAAQMDKAMRSAGADTLADAMNALDRALASRSGRFEVYGQEESAGDVFLKVANAPFAQAGMPLEQDYLNALASRYGAGVRLVDYSADPEAARKTINGWVKKQTAGLIPDLLAEPDVTALTRLVLVNAMYLKAPWLNPFDAADTKPARFTRADGSRVSVPMMGPARCQGIGICELPYAVGAGWRAVELPYLGDSLVMTIIVPDNLAAFERGLTAPKLARTIGALRTSPPGSDAVYDVAVSMPRFGIETRADLAGALAAMGMPLALDVETADFSGISPIASETGLYIRKVIHQASIDVDEKGTEAAAATAVVMATGGGPQVRQVAFRVDRPFLFLVRDVATGAVLFMGRVLDPSAK